MPDFNHSYIGGLVLLAQENDSDAFAELYALTYKHIYNYAGHYLRDPYLAQDAVQETYISALKNIKDIKDPSLFVAWINQICFHVCYDMSKTNDKGGEVALVSLARAGTSIGVLIKRYLQKKYGIDIRHYTISIIRGKGIDKNAMNHILENHRPNCIQFVDGWTGKGAIQNELNTAMREFPGVSPGLAVLSDPANIAEKCGTHDDFLIASSCLNSVVSGLMSRTFCRSDIIGANDYHGAAFYAELKDEDLTYQFIETVENCFRFDLDWSKDQPARTSGMDEVRRICKEYDIDDINFVKPSIGETTRVLLRRLPWKILVHSLDDNEHLGHLYQLAKEKGVEVIEYPLVNYRACGLIKRIADA